MSRKQPSSDQLYFKVVAASGRVVRIFTAPNLGAAKLECKDRYKPGTVYTVCTADAAEFEEWITSDD